MFLELIAAISAAFAGAGLALIVSKISGGLVPRWTIPVTAGAFMLGFAIWSEYAWYERTAARLPDGVEVVFQNESRAVFRPWTYAVPLINRFAAVDTTSIRTNERVPDKRIADMYFFQRWGTRQMIEVVFDCAERRHAPLPTVEFGPGGSIAQAAWTLTTEDDPTLGAACREA